ncbi:MAG: sigma-70 family RNA polymerase sigma factor [Opitutaceae bacterium]|nr:sigma-70 family RNA polymerase sigma factor [Opitutaceae bacterium]
MPDTPEALFAAIQREHPGLIMRIVQAFAPAPGERDDLYQEILLALWQAIPQFGDRSKLSTYVYRVALNCALNWQRSQRRYRDKLQNFARMPAESDPDLPPQVRARLQWLYARIHELPPVDRSLILLSLDRLDYEAIAEITGMSASNVGVRLHRIKQRLAAAAAEITHEI